VEVHERRLLIAHAMKLLVTAGGTLALPDPRLVLVDREDGGNLLVHPPRDVWERSELTAAELTQWSFLIAAAGAAMLDALPQLEGGCINYWEAGNWALNDAAPPQGPKLAREHRRVHMHLLGRSPRATSPDLQWGEAPRFPPFGERHAWASHNRQLTRDECDSVVQRAIEILRERYSVFEVTIGS
jgi:hypothetical protein